MNVAALSLGDIDGDGSISASDARIVLRTAVGLENYQPGGAEYAASDIDGDGKVTSADARIVLRISVHLDKIENYGTVPGDKSTPPSDEDTTTPPSGGKGKTIDGVYVPGVVEDGQQYQYVVNTNTHKFHHPGCRAVKDMKAKNRANSAASRDELVSCGFSPCGICKP